MKKLKKRHPKTHGKSKKRQRSAPAGAKRPAPLASTRTTLANFFKEKAPETSAELVEMMSKMNEAQLVEFVRTLGKIGAKYEPEDDFEPDEPDFDEFLDLCRSDDAESSDEIEEFAPRISLRLKQLKILADAGNSGAGRKVEAIEKLLADAAGDEDFPNQGLMMVAKVLADGDWQVPDALKEAVVRSLEKRSGPEAEGAVDTQRLVATMLTLSELVDNDEFALYQHVASMLAAFPTELAAQLVGLLTEAGRRVLDRTVVGFALHREPAIAEAALDALARIAPRPVENLVVERLVRIRPWTPPERHAGIDSAIEALRPSAESPVMRELRQIEKIGLTTCDPLGAQSILVSVRGSQSFDTLAVLLSPRGILDIMAFDGQTKSESDESLEALRARTTMTESDVAGLVRLLSLALADGLAQGDLPKFRLVQFVERLGIGPVTPEAATAVEIADELIAEWPDLATDDGALARVYREVVDAEWTSAWLESNATVDAILASEEYESEAAQKLLTDYMPRRKAFWAWICARSALASRGPAGRPPARDSLNLALIARDFASDRPVEEMPLMREIAERSAEGYWEYERED